MVLGSSRSGGVQARHAMPSKDPSDQPAAGGHGSRCPWVPVSSGSGPMHPGSSCSAARAHATGSGVLYNRLCLRVHLGPGRAHVFGMAASALPTSSNPYRPLRASIGTLADFAVTSKGAKSPSRPRRFDDATTARMHRICPTGLEPAQRLRRRQHWGLGHRDCCRGPRGPRRGRRGHLVLRAQPDELTA